MTERQAVLADIAVYTVIVSGLYLLLLNPPSWLVTVSEWLTRGWS